MEYITALTPVELQQLQTKLTPEHVLIIKFSATWCAPCKIIKPVCDKWLISAPPNVIWAEIDIDESIELFGVLKTKKMIKGVPTLLAFYGNKNKDRTHWYIPDDSFSGSDLIKLNQFLKLNY